MKYTILTLALLAPVAANATPRESMLKHLVVTTAYSQLCSATPGELAFGIAQYMKENAAIDPDMFRISVESFKRRVVNQGSDAWCRSVTNMYQQQDVISP